MMSDAVLGAEVTLETKPPDGCELKRIHRAEVAVVGTSSKRTDARVDQDRPEWYPTVSSGLFRACRDGASEALDIAPVYEEMLATARSFTTPAADGEIFTELQHSWLRDTLKRCHGQLPQRVSWRA